MKSSAAGAPVQSIGEMAARFGLGTHVLRHWEDVGLLAPARDSAGRRRYTDDHLVRMAVILRSKAAGMSLEQIGTMLDAGAPERHRVLEEHVADLERRMDEMRRSREMTLHAVRCRAHDIATCRAPDIAPGPRFRAGVQDILDGRAEAFPSFAD